MAPYKTANNQNLKTPLYSWKALDYQPQKKGVLWYIVFCIIFFGGSVWFIIDDPKWGWISAFTLFLCAAIYFFVHQKGPQTHEVIVYEKSICIDNKQINTNEIEGFWFSHTNPHYQVAYLELKSKKKAKIPVHIGQIPKIEIEKVFSDISVSKLENKKESLLDIWIMGLKL